MLWKSCSTLSQDTVSTGDLSLGQRTNVLVMLSEPPRTLWHDTLFWNPGTVKQYSVVNKGSSPASCDKVCSCKLTVTKSKVVKILSPHLTACTLPQGGGVECFLTACLIYDCIADCLYSRVTAWIKFNAVSFRDGTTNIFFINSVHRWTKFSASVKQERYSLLMLCQFFHMKSYSSVHSQSVNWLILVLLTYTF